MTWTLEKTDPSSGRCIYARTVPNQRARHYGTYDFTLERDFQVRTAEGDILLQTNGSAKGEYWCGVFLFFVQGTEGKQVRLDESDSLTDTVLTVPDTPIPLDKIWE